MNSRKKFNISDYLKKRNVKRFGLFMVIAFVFLIFSKLSNDYKQNIKLNIDLVNIEDEVMLQKDSLNTMDVLVEAKGFALVPFIFNNSKTVVLDAETDVSLQSENYVFDVQKHKYLIEGQLGSSYKILSVKPDTIRLPYALRASKFVPVKLNSNIKFAAGYDVKGDFKLDADSVKIVGTKTKIDSIKSISTYQLNLKDVNTDIDHTVDFPIINNIEIFPKRVNVKAEIKRFTEGIIQVPIQIVNKPSGVEINYFPKEVTVSYYVDLDNFKLIEASNFIVQCDYKEVNAKQNYFIPKITKTPDFIKRASIKQKRVDFIKL